MRLREQRSQLVDSTLKTLKYSGCNSEDGQGCGGDIEIREACYGSLKFDLECPHVSGRLKRRKRAMPAVAKQLREICHTNEVKVSWPALTPFG